MKNTALFRRLLLGVALLVNVGLSSSLGQNSAAASAVPAMVKFSGTVQGVASRPVGITFALYKDQQGGAPLWLETQSVAIDASGHFSVQLGATLPVGLPKELFTSGEARWLGVQPEGRNEQQRVLLLSVPYALKAADAETIGGLPPSAFVLAAPPISASSSIGVTTPGLTAAVPSQTPSGTVNFIPIFTDGSGSLGNSLAFQSGSGTTAKLGINTTTPAATLDVKGTGIVRGVLTLPSAAPATATKGANSQALNLAASAFNSGSNTAVNQNFRWQAEPAGNDTASPSATMNLLFASGTTAPTETGFKVSSKGQINFAAGQTFPGTGTITGVSVGPGLIGGGTGGNITVALTGSCGLGQFLQWNSVTWICTNVITNVAAGTDLTSSVTNGTATFNLDTSKVPQLNAANTFTGSQTVSGNLSATGAVIGSSFQIGSNLFGFGSYASSNAFMGFGGSLLNTGTQNTAVGATSLFVNTSGAQNTAVGALALSSNSTGGSNAALGAGALNVNSTGSNNTATGTVALQANTTGSYNTATGIDALFTNTTGNFNTAIGYLSGPDSAHPNLSNATAIGASATVTASNSMVLGSIAGVNGAGSNTNVGIGTTAPLFSLDVHGTGNFTGPVTFASTQTFSNTISGVTAGTGLTGGGTTGSVTLNLDTTKIPQLNAANSFFGNQTVTGNLTLTGKITTNAGSINAANGSFLATTGIGVYGQTSDATSVGVEGLANASTGGVGVFGASNAATGTSIGVWGKTNGTSSTSIGIEADAANVNALGLFASNIAGGFAAKFQGAVGVSGDLTGTGTISGTTVTGATVSATNGFSLGGTLFAFGSTSATSSYLGFAGNTNSTGSRNTAVGFGALVDDSSGYQNTAVGVQSLALNADGTINTAIGNDALLGNTSGSFNTATGGYALYQNATGAKNVASGFDALLFNTSGSNNVGVGSSSGYPVNANFMTGSYNTFLGTFSQPSDGTLNNATAIGANTVVGESNALVLGSINGVGNGTADTLVGIGTITPLYKLHVGVFNSGSFRVEGPSTANTLALAGSFGGFGDFGVDAPGILNGRFVVKEGGNIGVGMAVPTHIFQVGQGLGAAFADSWSTYSSRRWKTNIQTLPDALAKVEKLRGVSYDMKGSGKHEIGVIAEEVGEVVPEIVSFEANGKDAQGVDYTRLTAVLIEAVKQQQCQIRAQAHQIQTQARQISRLNGKVGVLETAIHTAKQAKSASAELASANPNPVSKK